MSRRFHRYGLFILGLVFVGSIATAEDLPPAEPAKEAGDVSVAEAKLGTAVKDRELSGEATAFKADVGRVYFWTRVEGPEDTEIKHVWYKGDTKVSEVVLKLKYKSTRTWSFKTIPADGTGAWKVEVVGPSGSVLKSAEFKIE